MFCFPLSVIATCQFLNPFLFEASDFTLLNVSFFLKILRYRQKQKYYYEKKGSFLENEDDKNLTK